MSLPLTPNDLSFIAAFAPRAGSIGGLVTVNRSYVGCSRRRGAEGSRLSSLLHEQQGEDGRTEGRSSRRTRRNGHHRAQRPSAARRTGWAHVLAVPPPPRASSCERSGDSVGAFV